MKNKWNEMKTEMCLSLVIERKQPFLFQIIYFFQI